VQILGQINPCKLSVFWVSWNFDQFDCCWEVLEQVQECAASVESLKSHQESLGYRITGASFIPFGLLLQL
jgi:hypothetical protein